MRTLSRSHCSTILLLAVLLALPAVAQDQAEETTPETVQTPSPTSGSDRMFLNFIDEATIVEGQWWEGQLELVNDDNIDSYVLRGTAAFRLRPKLEVGGTVGFGSTSSSVLPDGTGATDFDLYGKYYLGSSGKDRSEFAGGAILTIPTGDNTSGLGQDAFRLGIFASMRHRTKRTILNGSVGFRINDDAEISGMPKVDGTSSTWVGFGIIIPRSDKWSIIAETRYESEQLDGGDSIFSALGGINWRVTNRGMLRGAIDFGLDDGAPDLRLVLGYASTF